MKEYDKIPLTKKIIQNELSDEVKILENKKQELNEKLQKIDKNKSNLSNTNYAKFNINSSSLESKNSFDDLKNIISDHSNNLNSDQTIDDPFQKFDPFNINDNKNLARVEEISIKTEDNSKFENSDHFNNIYNPFDKQDSTAIETKEVS